MLLESRVSSLTEEYNDRLDSDAPGDLQDMGRRVEIEVSRRTMQLTEQLNEERAARYVAEQRLKELEEILNNSNVDTNAREERDDHDDIHDTLSTSLRGNPAAQKLFKHDLSVFDDLGFENRRSCKAGANGAERDEDLGPLGGKDLMGNEEHVRRSAPPDTEMWPEHMRPSLSARSASFADSIARSSTVVSRAIDLTRKRQRSFSDDRSLIPSLSKRRISEDNEASHLLEEAAVETVKAEEILEEDEGTDDDSQLASKDRKKLGMKHFTLLYHFTENGFNCRLCSIRKAEGMPDAKETLFPSDCKAEDLAKHCETVHPEGTENILSMSDAQLTDAGLKLTSRSP